MLLTGSAVTIFFTQNGCLRELVLYLEKFKLSMFTSIHGQIKSSAI